MDESLPCDIQHWKIIHFANTYYQASSGMVFDYGGKRYFDPGNKEAQQFVENVVKDMVSRYDVDAIHFDDYFYPYRIAGKEFGDWKSFQKYGKGMTRDEWRRSNVDSIIVMLGRIIKQENPYCKFGISPFGVWRKLIKTPKAAIPRPE